MLPKCIPSAVDFTGRNLFRPDVCPIAAKTSELGVGRLTLGSSKVDLDRANGHGLKVLKVPKKLFSSLCIMSENNGFWGHLAESARAEEKKHRGHGEVVRPLPLCLYVSVFQRSSLKRGSISSSFALFEALFRAESSLAERRILNESIS